MRYNYRTPKEGTGAEHPFDLSDLHLPLQEGKVAGEDDDSLAGYLDETHDDHDDLDLEHDHLEEVKEEDVKVTNTSSLEQNGLSFTQDDRLDKECNITSESKLKQSVVKFESDENILTKDLKSEREADFISLEVQKIIEEQERLVQEEYDERIKSEIETGGETATQQYSTVLSDSQRVEIGIQAVNVSFADQQIQAKKVSLQISYPVKYVY